DVNPRLLVDVLHFQVEDAGVGVALSVHAIGLDQRPNIARYRSVHVVLPRLTRVRNHSGSPRLRGGRRASIISSRLVRISRSSQRSIAGPPSGRRAQAAVLSSLTVGQRSWNSASPLAVSARRVTRMSSTSESRVTSPSLTMRSMVRESVV